MKTSIRMKIFLPVALILIIFPVAVWLMFRYTLDVHMNYNVKRDLELTVSRAESIINENYLVSAAAQAVGSEEQEGRLLSLLETELRRSDTETRMMAVSGSYRLLYPVDFEQQPELTEFYPLFLTRATGNEEFWEPGRMAEEQIDGETYLLYYRNVESEDPDQIRYLFFYIPIYDTSLILEQMSQFVFVILIVVLLFSLMLSWLVAGSISGPVIRLCEAARGIGEKKFKKVETGATVTELCQLEDEINQMQEKLAMADQAERTFFQNASHELRTPLMSISGYAQGIQFGVFEDTAQAAGIILDESTRLTEVVDGILTLTRMDQLRYQVVPVELNVENFVEERLELLEGFAYSNRKKLQFCPQGEHVITADAMLLERAFSNVVSNCIRYAEETVTVEIRDEDEMIHIRIMDDGAGIAEGEEETIFDRFHKGKNGNHGLGLAIARASMEYIGGTVRAENSEKGAVFTVTLPHDCRSFAPEDLLTV